MSEQSKPILFNYVLLIKDADNVFTALWILFIQIRKVFESVWHTNWATSKWNENNHKRDSDYRTTFSEFPSIQYTNDANCKMKFSSQVNCMHLFGG